MTWQAQVPGKAVLIGEYAVTDGLPAFSLAVDRCAEVELEPSPEDACKLWAPQLLSEPIRFAIAENSRLTWDRTHPQWARIEWTAGLIDRLVQTLRPAVLQPFQLKIDTSRLFINHHGRDFKLGLGSSSAIAIGLYQVLSKHVDSPLAQTSTAQATFDALLPVYRQAQNGEGSGIDLASSIHGGLIEFFNDGKVVKVNRRRPPDELRLEFAWTGQSASTPQLLKRYRAWQEARPGQAEAWHQSARVMLSEATAALANAEVDALVGLIGDYGRGMSTIGTLMGVDLTPAVHLAIMRQAASLGLAAKPSGAGVGDLALIAGTSASASVDAMQQIRDWMRTQGIPRVAMKMTQNGAQAIRVD